MCRALNFMLARQRVVCYSQKQRFEKIVNFQIKEGLAYGLTPYRVSWDPVSFLCKKRLIFTRRYAR